MPPTWQWDYLVSRCIVQVANELANKNSEKEKNSETYSETSEAGKKYIKGVGVNIGNFEPSDPGVMTKMRWNSQVHQEFWPLGVDDFGGGHKGKFLTAQQQQEHRQGLVSYLRSLHTKYNHTQIKFCARI